LPWQKFIAELRLELIDSYSPDLAPSDLILFPRLKVWLGGQRFSSNEPIIAFIEGYFAEQDTNLFE